MRAKGFEHMSPVENIKH